MPQYQAKIEYFSGAIFTFGVRASSIKDAIKLVDKIKPEGGAFSYVLPIPPANARRKPEDNP